MTTTTKQTAATFTYSDAGTTSTMKAGDVVSYCHLRACDCAGGVLPAVLCVEVRCACGEGEAHALATDVQTGTVAEVAALCEQWPERRLYILDPGAKAGTYWACKLTRDEPEESGYHATRIGTERDNEGRTHLVAFGHSETCCDAAGCAGDELRLGRIAFDQCHTPDGESECCEVEGSTVLLPFGTIERARVLAQK